MDIVILIILLIVAAFAFVEDILTQRQKLQVTICIGIVLILLSAFKDIESTTDALNYEMMFNNNGTILVELTTEPTYVYLCRVVEWLGGGVGIVFFIYALLTIPLKLMAIWRLTPFFFTALIIYVGIYYPLQDVVQIRAGAAAAFLLLSLLPYTERRYKNTFLLFVCAILFHYSSVAFLPVYLIGNYEVSKSWRYGIAIGIPVVLLLYVLGFNPYSLIPSESIGGKLELYQKVADKDTSISSLYIPYKQVIFLGKAVLLYLYIYMYDNIAANSKYASVVLKALALSMIYYVVLAPIPVIGSRTHDLLGIVDIVAFTYCLYCIKPAYLVKAGILGFALLIYVMGMLRNAYFM